MTRTINTLHYKYIYTYIYKYIYKCIYKYIDKDPGPAVGSNEPHSVSSNLLVNSERPCIEPSNKQQQAALLNHPRVPPTLVGLL